MGLRLPIRSDRWPEIGLDIAQHTIMIEQTAAAVVEEMAKRAFRNGVPQRPVKARIGPTIPPCANTMSQMLRYPKILLNPLNRSSIEDWRLSCTDAGAKLRIPSLAGSSFTIAHASAPTSRIAAADASTTARHP